jgi:predicted GNAT family acetyltransferase
MDELYEKTEALLKSLLSMKTGPTGTMSPSKDLMVPAIKPPSFKAPKPSIKAPTANKIPSGLPPPSKKDPIKVAQQLTNPNPGKVNVEVLKVESNGQWSLEKGALDPSHGYKFSHEHHDLGGGNMLTRVNVHSATGEHVGAATFAHQGNNIVPGTVAVDDNHQRRGIASAMYSHAQKHTGKTVVPSSNQTPEGAALWTGNKTMK